MTNLWNTQISFAFKKPSADREIDQLIMGNFIFRIVTQQRSYVPFNNSAIPFDITSRKCEPAKLVSSISLLFTNIIADFNFNPNKILDCLSWDTTAKVCADSAFKKLPVLMLSNVLLVNSLRQIHPFQQVIESRVVAQAVHKRVGSQSQQKPIALLIGFFQCGERLARSAFADCGKNAVLIKNRSAFYLHKLNDANSICRQRYFYH